MRESTCDAGLKITQATRTHAQGTINQPQRRPPPPRQLYLIPRNHQGHDQHRRRRRRRRRHRRRHRRLDSLYRPSAASSGCSAWWQESQVSEASTRELLPAFDTVLAVLGRQVRLQRATQQAAAGILASKVLPLVLTAAVGVFPGLCLTTKTARVT